MPIRRRVRRSSITRVHSWFRSHVHAAVHARVIRTRVTSWVTTRWAVVLIVPLGRGKEKINSYNPTTGTMMVHMQVGRRIIGRVESACTVRCWLTLDIGLRMFYVTQLGAIQYLMDKKDRTKLLGYASEIEAIKDTVRDRDLIKDIDVSTEDIIRISGFIESDATKGLDSKLTLSFVL
jgi:hypothetical protein